MNIVYDYKIIFKCFIQTVLLNCLTSEFIVIENPFDNGEIVSGVNMLNTHLFVHSSSSLCRYDLRGNFESKYLLNKMFNFFICIVYFHLIKLYNLYLN